MKTILTLGLCLAAVFILGACAHEETTATTTSTTTASTGYSK